MELSRKSANIMVRWLTEDLDKMTKKLERLEDENKSLKKITGLYVTSRPIKNQPLKMQQHPEGLSQKQAGGAR